jgi:hypothetical protein
VFQDTDILPPLVLYIGTICKKLVRKMAVKNDSLPTKHSEERYASRELINEEDVVLMR